MTSHPISQPQTILIVDDDADIRRLVADLLRREGYRVELAEDGAELDVVLRRTPVDLFVLDLMLPGEDGLSLCRRIRADQDTPILMLTAKGDETYRVTGLERGADDYLVKPFGTRELLARTGLRYVDRLAADPKAPTDVRIEAGLGYVRLAEVVGGGQAGQLGKMADANVLLAKAEAIAAMAE